jgi:flagellar basal-body rod modification protein FlgD
VVSGITSNAQSTTGTTDATGGSSTISSSGNLDSMSSTFLSLLTTELKYQDPTSPLDSTAMVGQMVAINQLTQLGEMNKTLKDMSSSNAEVIDQLTAIHQLLQPTSASNTSSTSTVGGA